MVQALRSFSCLTKGDTIAIGHADTIFHLDITDLKPSDAVSIYETDVNVCMLRVVCCVCCVLCVCVLYCVVL